MTPEQLATLKTAIIADPTANAIRLAGDTSSLMAWCNAASGTLSWRTAVQPQESDEAATYSTFDSLVAGKRDSWKLFLGYTRNFSRKKVRDWIVDVWGAATAASISEAILQSGTVLATRAEAVFNGTGKTTGTVTAINRTWEGFVSQQDANVLVN